MSGPGESKAAASEAIQTFAHAPANPRPLETAYSADLGARTHKPAVVLGVTIGSLAI